MFNMIDKGIVWSEKQLINGITYLSKGMKKTNSFFKLMGMLLVLNCMTILLISMMLLWIINQGIKTISYYIGGVIQKTWYDDKVV